VKTLRSFETSVVIPNRHGLESQKNLRTVDSKCENTAILRNVGSYSQSTRPSVSEEFKDCWF